MDETPSVPKQCESARRDGQRCRAPSLPDSTYCFGHDPRRAAARAAGRQRGGTNKAGIVRLRRLVPPRLVAVYNRLETALGEVHDGTLKPGQAVAMAALARAMVAVLQAGELEERVRKLEAQAG